MSSHSDHHWSGTSARIMVGPFPASFFIPVVPILFYHPLWFIIATICWCSLTVWLAQKGLGIFGLSVLFRRWLQGKSLNPRPRKTH